MLYTGGASLTEDVGSIEKASTNVVIGTPGRLCDLFERCDVKLKTLEVLILDEADVLLDMGFMDQVSTILRKLPKQRRTGLFSATQTRQVKALIRAGLRNPTIISIEVEANTDGKELEGEGDGGRAQRHGTATGVKQCVPAALENFYAICEADERLGVLVRFMVSRKDDKLIVFFATCACVDFFYQVLTLLPQLSAEETPLFKLHGKLKHSKRKSAYAAFVAAKRGVLFCTDVAARGIDIPDVDWIVQFHPPQDPSFFVHRVGRTARAGRAGKSLVLLLPKEEAYVPFLTARKVPIRDLEVEVNREDDRRIYELIKSEQFADRAILEHGTKAFISYIRSYAEHQCNYIFRLADLDMNKVATSFVLLRIPKLSELRQSKGIQSFEQCSLERVAGIQFKDKNREKQRQLKLAAWKELQRAQKLEKKGKKKKTKQNETPRKQSAAQRKEVRRRKKKGRQQQLYEEWDDLANEERLHKKLKKGAISKEEYEKLLFTA